MEDIESNSELTQRAILGAILENNNNYYSQMNNLYSELFTGVNRQVYDVLVGLLKNAYRATPYTVAKELNNIITPEKLITWVRKSIEIEDFETEILVLKENHMMRVYSDIAMCLSNKLANNIDVFEIKKYLIDQINAIDNITHEQDISFNSVLVELTKKLEKSTGEGIVGVDSGFDKINNLTGGWQRGDLIVIAGRPAMGKTAFVLSSIINSAERGVKAVLFNLEMSKEQLAMRAISNRGVQLSDMIQRRITDWNIFLKSRNLISDLDLKIYDKIFKYDSIVNRARALKQQGLIDVLIIDYLQLIIPVNKKNQNKENEISDMSRGFKLLAKELDIPIILLSQLNREVEKRGDKKPKLSDLRDSGAIEQDADIVGFLYRPEYYDIMQDDTGRDLTGKAYLLIEKHRNGALKDLEFLFKGNLTKFEEILDGEEKAF